MDSTSTALADHVALEQVVARALKRLKRLGYSRRSLGERVGAIAKFMDFLGWLQSL